MKQKSYFRNHYAHTQLICINWNMYWLTVRWMHVDYAITNGWCSLFVKVEIWDNSTGALVNTGSEIREKCKNKSLLK